MNNDESLDLNSLRSVVRFCFEKWVHGLATTMVAGEFYKLTDSEIRRLAEVVIG